MSEKNRTEPEGRLDPEIYDAILHMVDDLRNLSEQLETILFRLDTQSE